MLTYYSILQPEQYHPLFIINTELSYKGHGKLFSYQLFASGIRYYYITFFKIMTGHEYIAKPIVDADVDSLNAPIYLAVD
jgi:hypothetical protein